MCKHQPNYLWSRFSTLALRILAGILQYLTNDALTYWLGRNGNKKQTIASKFCQIQTQSIIDGWREKWCQPYFPKQFILWGAPINIWSKKVVIDVGIMHLCFLVVLAEITRNHGHQCEVWPQWSQLANGDGYGRSESGVFVSSRGSCSPESTEWSFCGGAPFRGQVAKGESNPGIASTAIDIDILVFSYPGIMKVSDWLFKIPQYIFYN